MKTPSERAAEAIIQDLSDRRGLKHEWHNIREDIQDEIRAEWSALIETHTLAGEMERKCRKLMDYIRPFMTSAGPMDQRAFSAFHELSALLAKLQSK